MIWVWRAFAVAFTLWLLWGVLLLISGASWE